MFNAIPNTSISYLFSDAMIALICYVFLYLTYYFCSDFSFIKKYRLKFNESADNFEKSVYLRRSIGFLLLGIIPFIIAFFDFFRPISDYGVGIPTGQYAWLWFLVPTLVISLGSIFRSGKKIDTAYYPEVRSQNWTKKRTIINAIFWVLYLLGYEFAIRGFVFFTSLYAFGLWPAIIINSALYSFIHIFKGPKEAYGAFFLGILFCLITYYTNSFWIAFVIHVLIAVINDIKAVKAKA